MDTLYMILKIAVALPFIIILIYLSLKLGGSKMQQLQNGNYIKILERVQITKENCIFVAKIGEKGYVVSSSQGSIEILLNIEDDEMKVIEKKKVVPQYDNIKDLYRSLSKRKEKV